MPARGERDVIASMPVTRFGVAHPYATGEVCPTIEEHNSSVDWLLCGMEKYPVYSQEENTAHGEKIQKLRREITHHALSSGIDLSQVRAGKQSLDSVLTDRFQRLRETAMELALHNYRLVRYTFFHWLPGAASGIFEDSQIEESVIQAGLLGIHEAALRYDPSVGKFSTYAVVTVQGQMISDMIQSRGMKVSEYILYKRIKQLGRQYEESGATYDFTDIARVMYDETHIDRRNTERLSSFPEYRQKLMNLMYKLEPISFEDLTEHQLKHPPIGSFDEFRFMPLHKVIIPDPVNYFEGALQEQRKKQVEAALLRLPERERDVLKLRFGFHDEKEYTLDEVGRFFDLTKERIRQIEAKGLRKLRHPTVARKLVDFV